MNLDISRFFNEVFPVIMAPHTLCCDVAALAANGSTLSGVCVSEIYAIQLIV